MFLTALKPMLTLCEEVIALAKEGNVDGARANFDRVRILQTLVSRAHTHQPSGVLAELKSQNLSLEDTQEQIRIAQSLRKSIDFIEHWIEVSAKLFR